MKMLHWTVSEFDKTYFLFDIHSLEDSTIVLTGSIMYWYTVIWIWVTRYNPLETLTPEITNQSKYHGVDLFPSYCQDPTW